MTPVPLRPEPSRRTVLCGLAAAVLVPTALAACSSDTEGASAPAAAPGTALTALSDVPVGGGVVVTGPDGPVVVVQPSAGQVAAFSAVCPHAGTTVGAPEDGVITCPNHGSQFAAESGELRRGPSTTGLTPVPVTVDGDRVMLA